MLALDTQPFFVVEDTGFIRLVKALEPRYTVPSRKYLIKEVLSAVYYDVMSKVSVSQQMHGVYVLVLHHCLVLLPTG